MIVVKLSKRLVFTYLFVWRNFNMNNSNIDLPKHSGLLLIIKKLYGVEVIQAAQRYILTAKKIACLSHHWSLIGDVNATMSFQDIST